MTTTTTNALELCNLCDGPIETPNPGGYCFECIGTVVIEGVTYSAKFNDDPDCPVSIWRKA